MNSPAPSTTAAIPAWRIAVMGMWLGALYGFLEAAEWFLMSLKPGRLGWVNGNTADAVWVAPIIYLLAFGLVGVLLSLAAAVIKRVPWDVVLMFVIGASGAYLAATLHPVLETISTTILSLGVATELTRQYAKRRERWSRGMVKSFPLVLAAIPIAALVVVYGGRWKEERAMAEVAKGGERPNVLLLVIDTERADRLSSYGYARQTTPTIDRLAAEGALYENAYSASSWTLPSHATLFTGEPLSVHRAGYWGHGYLEGKLPTLAEQFRDAGYATGGFVSNIFWTGRQTGLARGFVHYEDYYGNAGDAFYRSVLGRVAIAHLPAWVFDGKLFGRKSAASMNRDLLEWIDLDHVKGRPFFAFVNYFDVHRPYEPPPVVAGKWAKRPPHLESKEIDIGRVSGEMKLPPADELEIHSAMYDELLHYIDAQLGTLVEELKRRNQLDNTIILVTSDHGESFGEHGFMNHGHSLYKDQLHVPLVIRYPAKVAAGQRVKPAVGQESVAPTLLELAGLPTRPFRFPTLATIAASGDTATALAEIDRRSPTPHNWPASRSDLRSVQDERWHAIFPDSGAVELFDHVADPREERDLAGQPGADSVLSRLRKRLPERVEGRLEP